MPPKDDERQSKRQDGGRLMAPKTTSLSASMAAASQGGGRQLASIFAQFSEEVPSPDTMGRLSYAGSGVGPRAVGSQTPLSSKATEVNEAVVGMLRKITKRSNATRMKGLEDFLTYIRALASQYTSELGDSTVGQLVEVGSQTKVKPSEKSQRLISIETEVLSWLPEFCRVYRAGVLIDSERRIRCGLNCSLELVMTIMGKQIGPFLRSIFPVWWMSCSDRHKEVSSAAKKALEVSFPEEQKKKRVDLSEYCRDSLIDETFRLLSQTEDSLHLDLFGESYKSIPQGIRDERFDRVISSSLLALSQLIALLGTQPDKLLDWTNDLKPLFISPPNSNIQLSGFLSSSYRPTVRCAAAESLVIIFSTFHSLMGSGVKLPFDESDEDSVNKLSSVCLGIFGDNDSDVQPEKVVYPRILSSIRHNGYSTLASDVPLWRELPAVISAIPSTELIGTLSGREFIRNICPNILLALNKIDKSAVFFIAKPKAVEVFLSFFQTLIFLFEKRLLRREDILSPTPDPRSLQSECLNLINEIVDNWIWCPVELYLSSLSSTNGMSHIDLSSRSTQSNQTSNSRPAVSNKKSSRETWILNLDPSDLISIPEIVGWAVGECITRNLPRSILLRLEFLISDVAQSVFKFTENRLTMKVEDVQNAERYVEFVGLLDQKKRGSQFGSSSVGVISAALKSTMNCLVGVQKDLENNNDDNSMNRIRVILNLIKVLSSSLPSDDELLLPDLAPDFHITQQWLLDTVIEFIKSSVASFTSKYLQPTNSDVLSFNSRLAILKCSISRLITPIRKRLPTSRSSDKTMTQRMLDAILFQAILFPSRSPPAHLDLDINSQSSECLSQTESRFWEHQLGHLNLSALLAFGLLKETSDEIREEMDEDQLNRIAVAMLPSLLRQYLGFDVAKCLKDGTWDKSGVQILLILRKDVFELAENLLIRSSFNSRPTCCCSVMDALLTDGFDSSVVTMRKIRGIQNETELMKVGMTYVHNSVEFLCRSINHLLPTLIGRTPLPTACSQVGPEHLCRVINFCFEALLLLPRLSQSEETQTDEMSTICSLTVLFSALQSDDEVKSESLLRENVTILFNSIMSDEKIDLSAWVHSGIVLTNLLAKTSHPSMLGVGIGFWSLLKIYIAQLGQPLSTYLLNVSSDVHVEFSCHLSMLFIACDCPVKRQHVEISEELNDNRIVSDFIIAIWSATIRSREFESSPQYMDDYLTEVLISRVWMDSRVIQPSNLMERVVEMMIINGISKTLEFLFVDMLDVILVEITQIEMGSDIFDIFGTACLNILGLPLEQENGNMLMAIWDSQNTTAISILSMFLKWLVSKSINHRDQELLELRDAIYLSVADSVFSLETAVAESLRYPAKETQTLGRELTMLSDLMILTDDGESTPEDTEALLLTTQNVLGLAESCRSLIIKETGDIMNLLKFVECLSQWVFYIVRAHGDTTTTSLMCTALLLLKDTLLIERVILLPHSLKLLTFILSCRSPILEELQQFAAEAALSHLSRCDLLGRVEEQDAAVIADVLTEIGRMCSTRSNGIGGMVERSEPVVAESVLRLIYLITECAIEWKSSFLKVPAFEVLYNMQFPWLKVPLLLMSKDNPFRGESKSPQSHCGEGTPAAQLMKILEDGCKVPENPKKLEIIHGGSCGIRALLVLYLGEYFGSRVGGIGTYTEHVLSQILDQTIKNGRYSFVRDLRIMLNLWLILLTSIKRQRQEEGEENLSTPDPSALLELRPELILSSDEMCCQLRRIAQSVAPLSHPDPSIVSSQSSMSQSSLSHFLQSSGSDEFEHRPLMHALVELLALVLLLGHDGEESLGDAVTDDHNRMGQRMQKLQPHLRIPPGLKSHLALLKRGIDQDWIPLEISKIAESRKGKNLARAGTSGKVGRDEAETDEFGTVELDHSDKEAPTWDMESDWISRVTKDASIDLETIPILSKSACKSTDSLWVLSARLLLLSSELYPVVVRQCLSVEHSSWLSAKTLNRFEQIARSVITPRLLTAETETVKKSLMDSSRATEEGKNGTVSIQYDRHLRQLRCRVSSEELTIEAGIDFHDTHPLRCPNFKLISSTGIPKTKCERWVFSAKQVLLGGRGGESATSSAKTGAELEDDSWESAALYESDALTPNAVLRSCNGGSVTAALALFKANFNGFLSGLEDCAICYAIVHGRARSLPKQKCNTCKYKFHAECLERWFRTSHKNVCPLCQSEFL